MSSSRSRYSDLPKPDNGDVGEWARKIRDLQRQVDADEEAEHKRLQEEIAASRIARKRRSRGLVSPTNTEFSSSRESLSGVPDSKSIADKQQNQADALQKLSGTSSSPSNTDVKSSIASARAWMSSTSANTTASKASGPISLAAFMGGRATGPILNKHSPQQDAHDHTQFEDRTRSTAPHPVFGRGGIAMPGMIASSRFPKRDENGSSSPVVSPKYKNDTPPLVIRNRPTSPTKAVDERPVSPLKTDRDRATSIMSNAVALPQKNGVRERTISSPSPAFPLASPSEVSRERSLSPQKTGSRERTISTPGGFPKVAFASSNLSTETSTKRPVSPNFIPNQPSSPPHKSPVVTPSLAKPIRPESKPSPQAPQLSVLPNVSPAFLKPPVQKEPTPSLSRLQGRGFVQHIVKASHNLETPPSSTQTTPERPLSGARKASVLERWQHQTPSSPSPVSPPAVTKPLAMRKSWTADPTPSLKAGFEQSSIPPKPAKTLPPMSSQPILDRQGTGLGSATTLVVFKPSADEEGLDPLRDVSELGVKRSAAAVVPSQQKLPVATGKPLNHPTRERVRKPKKPREASGKVKDEGASPPWIPQFPVEPTRIATPPPESESPTFVEPSRPALVTGFSSGSGVAGRIADRWADQTIIGVKSMLSHTRSTESEAPKVGGMVGRRALPGLAAVPNLVPSSVPVRHSPSPSSPSSPSRPPVTETPGKPPPSSSPTPKYPFEQNHPTSPSGPGGRRHSRIPSTGNRATVMDVAQALAEPEHQDPSPMEDTSSSPEPVEEPEPLPPLKPTLRQNIIAPSLERRRSSYNSAITLPPLQEEATPVPTPAGTLARGTSPAVEASFPDGTLKDVFDRKSGPTASEDPDVIQLNHDDGPLPKFDVDTILKAHQEQPLRLHADITTISVEVMVISGSNATVISRDTEVFYDAEVLAIVYRSKSKSKGLVSTTVWAWFGRNSVAGELEQTKLEELAKRYGTSLIVVNQYFEPLDMLQTLGNKLAVRQGKRTHWSVDNTAMHVVRSKKGVIFIDELEFNIRNLCSGFSYCLTVLETIYVWYGRGSMMFERNAALTYGRSLGENVVELYEGQSDADEMFWMILGEDAFANANYWQWRPSAVDAPRLWIVSDQTVKPIGFMNMKNVSSAIHLVDCVWEFFVVVGSEARAQRQNIRFALHVAKELIKRVAGQRPHTPPTHFLILPSQVPLDLKMHFRELDESLMNLEDVPDHMNLLRLDEAYDHLKRTSWERFSLRDPNFLPLGVHPDVLNKLT